MSLMHRSANYSSTQGSTSLPDFTTASQIEFGDNTSSCDFGSGGCGVQGDQLSVCNPAGTMESARLLENLFVTTSVGLLKSY
jgi:hypothetical protein